MKKIVFIFTVVLMSVVLLKCDTKTEYDSSKAKRGNLLDREGDFSEYLFRLLGNYYDSNDMCFMHYSFIYSDLKTKSNNSLNLEIEKYRDNAIRTLSYLDNLLDELYKNKNKAGWTNEGDKSNVKEPEQNLELFLFGDSILEYLRDTNNIRVGNSAKIDKVAGKFRKESSRIFTSLSKELSDENNFKEELKEFHSDRYCSIILHPYLMSTYEASAYEKELPWEVIMYEDGNFADAITLINILKQRVREIELQGLLLIYMALLEEERLKNGAAN